MTSVTIREAQHNLAKYLRLVEDGEEVEIRRRDKVVARLVPGGVGATYVARPDWGAVAERRQQLWGGKPVSGAPASQIVSDGRGDR